eukprot:CAMPEP_0176412534 /NCGR_PEP_ID=MMETSP0127-20121128/4193_1 /TAXON_ID=938130 /ORGANISM="Platyophrya macrostoma, Strain WH" /LENGTH=743 /DNA_ID=CAMNT_0017792207 /DNA_START=320 /DNA_END=2551 /DNA_ORIENTATION=-
MRGGNPMMGGMGGLPQQMPHIPMPNQTSMLSQLAENLLKTGPLSELTGKKLAVDGCKVFESITVQMRIEEKLSPLTAAVPSCAYVELSRLVAVCKHIQTLPEFVFPGMSLTMNPKDKEAQKPRDHNQNILLLNGNRAQFTEKLRNEASAELNPSLDEDGENYIFSYTKFYPDIQTTRAPYWSWAQIASYFNRDQIHHVDEVYGCYEMIAFRGIDRVITRMDLETDTYSFVTKADFLHCFGLTERELPYVVAALSMHKLLNDPPMSAMPMPAFEFLSRYRDLGCHPAGKGSSHDLRAARGALAIQHCPILTPEGQCVPLSVWYGQSVPKKWLRMNFGSVLPPIYYFLHMSGMLSSAVLSTVANRQIVDSAPAVDCVEFRQVAEYIIPLRTQIVFQLVQGLRMPQLTQAFDITWIRRYNNNGSGREMPILQPPQIKLDEWNTSDFRAPAHNAGSVYFSDVLPLAQHAMQQAHYPSTEQALAAILLKALDLLGYFTHATQAHNAEVSGASVYSNALEHCKTATLSEYAVLLIELLRTKTLTDKPLSVNVPRPNQTSQPVNPALFASRLLSIYPITLAKSWTAPVSADLCAFNGMARSLHRTLRSLCEVISVVTLCDSIEGSGSSKPQYTINQYQKDIQPKLPFATPLMCCSGIIVQYIFEHINIPKEISMEALMIAFPDCLQLPNDLYSMFYFWYYAGMIIQTLSMDDPELMGPASTLFSSAHVIMIKASQILFPTSDFSFLKSLM